MSVMEIPDETYDAIFADQVVWALNRDPMHDLSAARRLARETMDSCFVRRSTVYQSDCEKDDETLLNGANSGDWTA